jgi:hypothetical protein
VADEVLGLTARIYLGQLNLGWISTVCESGHILFNLCHDILSLGGITISSHPNVDGAVNIEDHHVIVLEVLLQKIVDLPHVEVSLTVRALEESWLEAWGNSHFFDGAVSSFASKRCPELFGFFALFEASFGGSTWGQEVCKFLGIVALILRGTLSKPIESGVAPLGNHEESLIGVEILGEHLILLDGLWCLTEWTLHAVEGSVVLDPLMGLAEVHSWTVVANETIWEELQQSVVLVTLHH